MSQVEMIRLEEQKIHRLKWSSENAETLFRKKFLRIQKKRIDMKE